MNRRQERYAQYIRRDRQETKGKNRKVFLEEWKGEDQTLIRSMTNWQRSQWAKAGYPQMLISFYVKLTKEANKQLFESVQEIGNK